MVASRQAEIPFSRGVGGQRRWGLGALAQVFGKTAIPFLRQYIVSGEKRVGADFLQIAAPKNVEVASETKNFKTAAKSVGRDFE